MSVIEMPETLEPTNLDELLDGGEIVTSDLPPTEELPAGDGETVEPSEPETVPNDPGSAATVEPEQEQPEPESKDGGLFCNSTILQRIKDQGDWIRTCEEIVDSKKASLKEAKEQLEEAMLRLRVLCDELTASLNDEDRPLFNQVVVPTEPEAATNLEEKATRVVGVPGTRVMVRITKDLVDLGFDPPKLLVSKGAEIEATWIETQQEEDRGEILDAVELWIKCNGEDLALDADEYEIIQELSVPVAEAKPEEKESEPENYYLYFELQKTLEISDTILQRFVAAGINNLDDLKVSIASGFDLTKIKGIGKAKAEKIIQKLK